MTPMVAVVQYINFFQDLLSQETRENRVKIGGLETFYCVYNKNSTTFDVCDLSSV